MRSLILFTIASMLVLSFPRLAESADNGEHEINRHVSAGVVDETGAKKLAQVSEEKADRDFWKSIEGSKNIEDFKSYLEWFPIGQFVSRAKSEIERLKGEGKTGSQKAGSADTFQDCDVCPEMVVIPSGRFILGSTHEVKIRNSFAAGKHEVTVDQFLAFANETGHDTGNVCYGFVFEARVPGEPKSWLHRDRFSFRNPGFEQTGSHPVTCVSWEDAKKYVEWLSGKTGRNYRLLTESEWEYAARGGTSTRFWWGDEPQKKYANWNFDNLELDRHHGTTPVGSFQANEFGLYDVIGNVNEWVEDCWHDNFKSAPRNGSAWLGDSGGDCGRRVMRSGSWEDGRFQVSIISRGTLASWERDNRMGFRVALSLD